jgi:uncharacterized protein involved in response to NO
MVVSRWRREPFRIFFPLGTALAWIGVGHWLAYWLGWINSYSCQAHGVVQIQGFLLAFALGFLLTALPRRTESAPPPLVGLAVAAVALVVTTVAAFAERWWVAAGGTVAIVAGVITFAVGRFVSAAAGRRPPAAFVLLPMGLACAVAGALLVAWGSSGGPPLGLAAGRLLVEQAFFFCLVMGTGALVLPLMGGATPPPDLGSSPAVTRAALGYAAAGLAVIATVVAEAAGSERLAPIARGLVVGLVLARGAGVFGRLDRPGWNRRVARLAAGLVPVGPILAGLLPDFRVAALHVTFMGGFGLLAFAVGTHVTASHLEMPDVRDGRAPVVATVASAVLVAMAGRVIADGTATYFEHLASAAAVWIAGTAIWVGRLGPAWLRRG